MNSNFIIITMLVVFSLFSCKETSVPTDANETISDAKGRYTKEKAAILSVLNEETKAAFTRDYETWKDQWVHEAYVTKTYMQFTDSTMTETVGWNEINQFVLTYFKDHPEPDPLPQLLQDIDVRLYENGAWVSYNQEDPERGLKRETRLMEKIGNQWKIAGMHTTIYGDENRE
ncbi:hypothetical protein ABN763_11785 [Spongiivirga sp. MCCC 1A20706]|uniref:hypothetical protein n=1 Tax=Spongiivirga sp. MCCC 1A20706 TaxID=3160963 RepID=UPI003977692A